MKMVLQKEHVPSKEFVEYLLDKIRVHLIENLSKENMKMWDAYFANDEALKGATLREIVGESLKAMTVEEHPTTFEIAIKSSARLSRTNAKLYEVCKLINYGNLSIMGSNIYTKTFRYFNEHIQEYIEKFLMTTGEKKL